MVFSVKFMPPKRPAGPMITPATGSNSDVEPEAHFVVRVKSSDTFAHLRKRALRLLKENGASHAEDLSKCFGGFKTEKGAALHPRDPVHDLYPAEMQRGEITLLLYRNAAPHLEGQKRASEALPTTQQQHPDKRQRPSNVQVPATPPSERHNAFARMMPPRRNAVRNGQAKSVWTAQEIRDLKKGLEEGLGPAATLKKYKINRSAGAARAQKAELIRKGQLSLSAAHPSQCPAPGVSQPRSQTSQSTQTDEAVRSTTASQIPRATRATQLYSSSQPPQISPGVSSSQTNIIPATLDADDAFLAEMDLIADDDLLASENNPAFESPDDGPWIVLSDSADDEDTADDLQIISQGSDSRNDRYAQRTRRLDALSDASTDSDVVPVIVPAFDTTRRIVELPDSEDDDDAAEIGAATLPLEAVRQPSQEISPSLHDRQLETPVIPLPTSNSVALTNISAPPPVKGPPKSRQRIERPHGHPRHLRDDVLWYEAKRRVIDQKDAEWYFTYLKYERDWHAASIRGDDEEAKVLNETYTRHRHLFERERGIRPLKERPVASTKRQAASNTLAANGAVNGDNTISTAAEPGDSNEYPKSLLKPTVHVRMENGRSCHLPSKRAFRRVVAAQHKREKRKRAEAS